MAEGRDSKEQSEFRECCRRWLAENRRGPRGSWATAGACRVVDGIAPALSGPPFERAELRAEARVVEQHGPLTREPREQVAVELRLRAIGGLVRDPMAAERVARPLAGITVPGDARDLSGTTPR
jgi:hypothetical protein